MKLARRTALATAMLAVALPGVVLADGSDDFVDVPDGAFYDGAVGAIFDAGVTAGCATGPARYCPNDPVTRGQMAVFIDRVLGHPAPVVDATTLDGLDSSAFVRTNAALDADTLGGLAADAFLPAGVLNVHHSDWSFSDGTSLFRGISFGAIPNGATITSVRVRAFDVDGNTSPTEIRLATVPFQVNGPITGGAVLTLVPAGGFATTVTEYTVTADDIAAAGLPTTVDHDTALWGIDGTISGSSTPPYLVQLSVFYAMP